jgi:hypothetical protein
VQTFTNDGRGSRTPVQPVVTVDKDRARQGLGGLDNNQRVGSRNAIVSDGDMDVPEAMFRGQISFRGRAIHTDEGLHAEALESGETRLALWRRTREDAVAKCVEILDARSLHAMKFSGRHLVRRACGNAVSGAANERPQREHS